MKSLAALIMLIGLFATLSTLSPIYRVSPRKAL